MILAGTGSRSLKMGSKAERLDVWHWILAEIDYQRPDFIMSGMAEGFDEALAKAALTTNVPLIAALPTKDYGNYYWGRKSLTGSDRTQEFEELLQRAHSVVHVCSRLYEGGVHANFVRNGYMASEADSFLVYKPESRGTKDCMARITKEGKSFTIYPEHSF